MKISNIWTVSLCLLFTQSLIHCAPSIGPSKRTILSTMDSQLSSKHGYCRFPPEDVVNDIDNYEFLEPCNRKIPLTNVSDESLIRCMGLLEVGLGLCSLDQNSFVIKSDHGPPRLDLPTNSQMFNKLLEDLRKTDSKNLCTDLKKDNVLGTHNYPFLNGWNLINVLKETEESCTRICFNFKNNPDIMCQLILWGSHFMAGTLSKTENLDYSQVDPQVPNRSQNSPTGPGIESKSVDVGTPSQGQQIRYTSSTTSNGDGSQIPPIIEVVNRPTGKSEQSVAQPEIKQNQTDLNKNNQPYSKPETSELPDKLPSSQHSPKPYSDFQPGIDDDVKPLEGIKPGAEAATEVDEHVPIKDSTKVISNPIINPTMKEQQVSKGLVAGGNEKLSLPPDHKQELPSTGDHTTLKTRPAPPSVVHGPTSSIEDPDENPPPMSEDRIPLEDVGQSQEPDEDVNFEDNEPASPELNPEPSSNLVFENNNYKSQQEDLTHGNIYSRDQFEDQEDSHFFSYFMTMVILCMVVYVVFHNKQKIMALVLEGRSKRASRRRPTTANYHKLDNNLEEAVSSPCSTSVTHVIY